MTIGSKINVTINKCGTCGRQYVYRDVFDVFEAVGKNPQITYLTVIDTCTTCYYKKQSL